MEHGNGPGKGSNSCVADAQQEKMKKNVLMVLAITIPRQRGINKHISVVCIISTESYTFFGYVCTKHI